MKTVYLITPLSKKIPIDSNADYIGIDAGALRILEAGLPLKMAVGDFDSMEEDQYKELEKVCPIERHPVMKDETDGELGIWIAQKLGYDRIIFYGALSGRIDHTVLNIRMIMYRYPEIILQDDTQMVMVLKEGSHVLKNTYKNISFLPIDDSCITLKGFLYTLDHRDIYKKDMYTTSNSFVDEEAEIIVHKGSMLCLMTNER